MTTTTTDRPGADRSDTRTRAPAASWCRRVLWLVGIWLASVAVMAAVAALLRWVMRAVGLSG